MVCRRQPSRVPRQPQLLQRPHPSSAMLPPSLADGSRWDSLRLWHTTTRALLVLSWPHLVSAHPLHYPCPAQDPSCITSPVRMPRHSIGSELECVIDLIWCHRVVIWEWNRRHQQCRELPRAGVIPARDLAQSSLTTAACVNRSLQTSLTCSVMQRKHIVWKTRDTSALSVSSHFPRHSNLHNTHSFTRMCASTLAATVTRHSSSCHMYSNTSVFTPESVPTGVL